MGMSGRDRVSSAKLGLNQITGAAVPSWKDRSFQEQSRTWEIGKIGRIL